jgi:hypothetical protein
MGRGGVKVGRLEFEERLIDAKGIRVVGGRRCALVVVVVVVVGVVTVSVAVDGVDIDVRRRLRYDGRGGCRGRPMLIVEVG